MISRRDIIIGGACLAAAGGAEAMRPKNRVSLLGDRQLDKAVPHSFGVWKAREGEGIIAPQSENSLSAKLYNQTVSRMYTGPDENVIMLLMAYGNTQSDTLQLHRPEVCYPAFGFEVASSQATRFDLGGGASLPGRNLVARGPGREERISYWTRVGEYMPVDNEEQRRMRFRIALAGIIPDGVLVRVSNMLPDDQQGFALNGRFIADLIRTVPQPVRPALITTATARQLSGTARA